MLEINCLPPKISYVMYLLDSKFKKAARIIQKNNNISLVL